MGASRLLIACTVVVVCADECVSGTCEADDADAMKVSMLQVRGDARAVTAAVETDATLAKRRAEILSELADIEEQLAAHDEPAPGVCHLIADAHARSTEIFVSQNYMFHPRSRIMIGSGPNSMYTVSSKGSTPQGLVLHLAEPLHIAYAKDTPVCSGDKDPQCLNYQPGADCNWHKLWNKGNDKILTMKEDGSLGTYPAGYKEFEDQLWRKVDVGQPGYFKIENKLREKVLFMRDDLVGTYPSDHASYPDQFWFEVGRSTPNEFKLENKEAQKYMVMKEDGRIMTYPDDMKEYPDQIWKWTPKQGC